MSKGHEHYPHPQDEEQGEQVLPILENNEIHITPLSATIIAGKSDSPTGTQTVLASPERTPPVADAQTVKKKRIWLRYVGYVALGIFSFLFFLYVTFPYAILKESLIVASESVLAPLDLRLNVHSLRPKNLGTGIVAEKVTLTHLRGQQAGSGGAQIAFDKVVAQLHVWKLALGTVQVRVQFMQDVKKQRGIDVVVKYSLFSLLQQRYSDMALDVNFKSFAIDNTIHLVLTLLRMQLDEATRAMVGNLLSSIQLRGFIGGSVQFEADTAAAVGSMSGSVALKFSDLVLAAPEVKLAEQVFQDAHMNITLLGQDIAIKNVRFKARDIDFALKGSVKTEKPNLVGGMSLDIYAEGAFARGADLLFGSALNLLKCPVNTKTTPEGVTESSFKVRLSGSLGQLSCIENPN